MPKLNRWTRFSLASALAIAVGSCGDDPRSTTSGNPATVDATVLEPDFSLRNAWHLRMDDGELIWVSDDAVLDHQPEPSFMRRIEDWFLSLLPLEKEM